MGVPVRFVPLRSAQRDSLSVGCFVTNPRNRDKPGSCGFSTSPPHAEPIPKRPEAVRKITFEDLPYCWLLQRGGTSEFANISLFMFQEHTSSEISGTDPPQGLICPNCQTSLRKDDLFCSHCGQETAKNRPVPFLSLVQDFMEGLFDFDTKIWRTLIQLLKNPGRVVKDFNSYKRGRYVAPLRLYVSVSVLFFLLAGSGVKKQAHEFDNALQNNRLKKGFQIGLIVESVRIDSFTARKLFAIRHITEHQVDSILRPAGIKATALSVKVIQQLIHLNRKETSSEEIGDRFVNAFSKILFLLMPLFGFLLWLLLGPRKIFFTEVLIYSVYFHSLYFILLILALLGNRLTGLSGLNYLAYGLACIYTVPSLRIAFDLSYARAAVISLLLISLYTVLFILVMTFALIGSLVV